MCSMCERVSVRWCLNTSALHASRIHSPRMLPVDSKVESEVSINHLPFLCLPLLSSLPSHDHPAGPIQASPDWLPSQAHAGASPLGAIWHLPPLHCQHTGAAPSTWRPPALSRQRLMAALTHSGQAGIEGDMERYGAGRKHVVQT